MDGFTLIELLMVVLIIAILIAIAAPSFLGQSHKAADSATKQYLSISYRAAKAAATDNDGFYPNAAGLVTALEDSEPGQAVGEGDCSAAAAGPVNKVWVDPGSGGSTLILHGRSGSHTIFKLSSSNFQGPVIAVDDCNASAVVVNPPTSAVPPLVSGTPQVGEVLTATTGSWSSSPTGYSYQWQHSSDNSSWSNVASGGSSSTYVVHSSDLDDYLRVSVTAANSAGSATASSLGVGPALPAIPLNNPSQPPEISGTVQVGQTLTASQGSWSSNPTACAYQWQRSPDGSAWTNIPGATSSSYTAQVADLNQYLRVVVTCANAGGSSSASSDPTAQVLPAAPANVSGSPPAISGTAQVGQTLTASQGSWSSNPTACTYQWQRSSDGADWITSPNGNIAGATASTYTVQAADLNQYLRVVVTCANAGGSGSASSDPTAQVLPAAPANVSGSPPVVSGTAQVGQTLSTTDGSWTGNPTGYSYQWQHSADGSAWSNVGSGGNASSYVVQSSDLDDYLRVTVTAQNAGGSSSASSDPTAQVLPANPASTAAPTISGTAQEGQTLTASQGSWSNSPTGYAYQWQSSPDGSTWSNVASGGTSSSYVVQSSDLDDYLRVTVTAANSGGSGVASSDPTSQVLPANPVNTVPPFVSGTVQEGHTLSTTNGTWTNSPTGYSYQWQHSSDGGSSWSNVASGGNASSYTVQASDIGDYIRSIVTASNAGGSASASSNATVSAATPDNPVNSTPPTISGTPQVGQPLTADPGSWTNSPTGYSYQWQYSADGSDWHNVASDGTSSSYTPTNAELNDYLRVIVQAQNAGGSGSASSATTASVLPAVPTNNPGSPPAISGTAQVGQTLNASQGSWTNSPTSCGYQWQRSPDGNAWTNIPGATSSSYTVQSADLNQLLRVVVTCQNAGGSGSATSDPTGSVLPAAPLNTTQPLISDTSGNPMTNVQVGDSLSTTTGTWSDCTGCAYSYTWQRASDSNFTTGLTTVGTNASTYTVQSGDETKYIRVSVQATGAGGSGSAFSSNQSNAILPSSPANTTQPLISDTSGNPMTHVQAGDTLSTTNGAWTNSPIGYSYTWQRADDSGFATGLTTVGINASTYTPVAADIGKYVRVSVQAQNGGGAGSAFSSNQTNAILAANPVNTAQPTVCASPTVVTSTACGGNAGSWTGATLVIQKWQRCNSSLNTCAAVNSGSGWTDILSATSISYTPVIDDAGYLLRLLVTASNASGSTLAFSGPANVAGRVVDVDGNLYNLDTANVVLTYSGAQQTITPRNSFTMSAKLWGAAGGTSNRSNTCDGIACTGTRNSGGAGGFAGGTITTTAWATYKAVVGQAGTGALGSHPTTFGGGGSSPDSVGATDFSAPASGGGYSGYFVGTVSQGGALLVAGGGGGGQGDPGMGGAGGGATSPAAGSTSGATQSAGGSGGGGTGTALAGASGNSGGGGGYFGGGGGSGRPGSGGSGYFAPSFVSGGVLTAGINGSVSGVNQSVQVIGTPGNAGDSDRAGAGSPSATLGTAGASGRIVLSIQSLPLPPSSPTGLATSNPQPSSVTLSWSAPSGATGYDLYNGATYVASVGSGTTSYNFGGLTCGATYTLGVAATNSGGSSATATVSGSTASCAPAQPVITGTSNGYDAGEPVGNRYYIIVTYTQAPSGITSNTYYLNGAYSSNSNPATQNTFRGLTCGGQSYTFGIEAVGPGGTSTRATTSAGTSACQSGGGGGGSGGGGTVVSVSVSGPTGGDPGIGYTWTWSSSATGGHSISSCVWNSGGGSPGSGSGGASGSWNASYGQPTGVTRTITVTCTANDGTQGQATTIIRIERNL